MSKKLLLGTFFILVLVGATVFITIKIQKRGLPQGAGIKAENTFQAGWDAAKERLKQSQQYAMSIPAGVEVRDVTGTIQKIEGDKLTVEIKPLEPLADPALDTRVITIDSNLKITLHVKKDQVQFQKEMEEYNAKMAQSQEESKDPTKAPAPSPIVPPSEFEKRDINLSELKEGQLIFVSASEDIKEKKEFKAFSVQARDIETVGDNAPIPSAPTNNPAQVVPISSLPTENPIQPAPITAPQP